MDQVLRGQIGLNMREKVLQPIYVDPTRLTQAKNAFTKLDSIKLRAQFYDIILFIDEGAKALKAWSGLDVKYQRASC